MARRSEHSREEIKEMVLKAAETIVVEDGYPELKVRKIALEVGYTVGSIYMVFDNMDDLVLHLKARALDELLEQVDMAIGQGSDIAGLTAVYLEYARNNFNKWSMIFGYRLKPATEIPDWYQHRVNHLFLRVEKLFAELDPACSAKNIKQAARSLWGGVHGVCVLFMTGGFDVVGMEDIEVSVKLVADCFIRGWLNRDEAV